MTDNNDSLFPSYRALSAWQKHLRRHRARAIWLRRLFLYCVEAQVELSDSPPFDQLDGMVLETLAESPVNSKERLVERLQLPLSDLHPFLLALQRNGLVDSVAEGWTLTAKGKHCNESHRAPPVVRQRQLFYFEEPEELGGLPRYLPLIQAPTEPWETDVDEQFDVRVLDQCIAQSPEWKRVHRFPQRVQGRCKVTSAELASADPQDVWARVMLARPEQLWLILLQIKAPKDKEQLLGFAVQAEDWRLHHQDPVLKLGRHWRDVFPDLAPLPDESSLREAWREWARAQGMPPTLLDNVELEIQERQLIVRGPDPLLSIIRKSRPEAFKGEAWILVGTGRFRRLVQLRLYPIPAQN